MVARTIANTHINTCALAGRSDSSRGAVATAAMIQQKPLAADTDKKACSEAGSLQGSFTSARKKRTTTSQQATL